MWANFVIESKQYMGYSKMGYADKLRFWRRFPVAAFRYYIALPIRYRVATRLWMVRNMWGK